MQVTLRRWLPVASQVTPLASGGTSGCAFGRRFPLLEPCAFPVRAAWV